LLDWTVIAVRDHRSNIHRDIPFHFDLKGELLPRVLCYQNFLLLLLMICAHPNNEF